jgi:uncharacterized membrane protein (UPF0127 family)
LGARELVAIAVALVVVSAAVYIAISSPTQAYNGSVPSKFSVNGKTFAITYVATTYSQQTAGLDNKKITNGTTMLFIFSPPGIETFWMDTVNSSLDIIWLQVNGNSGQVVYLVANAPVCSLVGRCDYYTPTSNANYVLEARGGFASANGIVVGTTIQFS